MRAEAPTIRLSRATIRRLGVGALATLMLCGLCAEVRHALAGAEDESLRAFFSLSYEGNLPTWFASGLLLLCAVSLALIAWGKAEARDRFANHWFALAAVFAYLSIDEFVCIHEHMNAWFDLGGVLYFGWVIPASAAVAVLGLCYLRFLAHLPAATRRRVLVAAALYVGGALGVELGLGWWTDRAGDEGLVYALIDFVEESMELMGAAYFLDTLLGILAAGGPTLQLMGTAEARLSPAPDAPGGGAPVHPA